MAVVLLEKKGFIATITINRPEVLNALNIQVISELDTALIQLKDDTSIRVILITGSGEKSFVAGADIKEFEGLTATQGFELAVCGQKLFQSISEMPQPVIAVVNGFALGGGLELALACDFIIASNNAKFALPEVGLGLIPGYGGTQKLPRVVGLNLARRMIFSGEMISADDALHKNIVTEVTTPQELMPRALKIAETIASKAPLSVSWAKQAIQQGFETDIESGLKLEASFFSKTFDTDDQTEGVSAFVAKRKPEFKGK